MESDKIYDKWRNLDQTKITAGQFAEWKADVARSQQMWAQLDLPDFTIFATSSGESILPSASSQPYRGDLAGTQTPSANSSIGNASSLTSRPDSVNINGIITPPDTTSITGKEGNVNEEYLIGDRGADYDYVPFDANNDLARPQDAQETAPGEITRLEEAAALRAAERGEAEIAFDLKRAEEAASTLGRNGAKALGATYDGEVELARFYPAFAAYYEAGVSGIEMDDVRSDYADALTPSQQFAAYAAGQNDAKLSLATERRAAAKATRALEPGFIQNEYSKELSKNDIAFFDAIGKATGSKIVMAAPTGKGGVNGWYENGVIYIAQDAENAYAVVAKHEITHRVQELAPEAYRAYRDYAMKLTAREFGGSTAKIIEAYKARYAEYVKLSTEEAMDEIAADFTEKLLVDEAVIKQFVADDRTLAQKILDAIKEFIGKVKNALKGGSAKMAPELEKAVQLWTKALEEASKEKGNLAAAAGEQAPAYTPEAHVGTIPENNISAAESGVSEFSLKTIEFQEDRYFARQMDRWAELKDGARVKVGVVMEGSALHKVGLPAAGLYFDVGKIKKAMAAHSDHLNENVLKGIPELLSSPIAITEYSNNTVNVFGELFADGMPVTVGIVITKDASGRNLINKVRTVHARTNLKNLINNNTILYLNENKNRVRKWFQVCGNLNVPLDGTQSGLIRSIQYKGETVKRYSLKEAEENRKKAIEYFGRTNKWAETGYLLTDGTRLDFSGRRDGGPGGYRTEDHREIRSALGADYGGDTFSGGMVHFMAEGNIRISPESNGINLSVPPTKAQESALADFITRAGGEVILDIDDIDGNTISSTEYPEGTRASKVISDIRKYFEDGTLPKVLAVSRFRYSLKKTGYELDETGKVANFTEQRLDSLYDEYSTNSNYHKNYAKAYVAYISPEDFLSLTSTDKFRPILEGEAEPLDIERLQKYQQEIRLIYDPENPGEVWGHEGRHRMIALKNAGVEKVAIVVKFLGEEGKYDRQPISSLTLRGEEFSSGRAPGEVTLTDLLPLSPAYREEVYAKFGAESALRYSLKGARNLSEEIKQLTEMNEFLKDQVNKLKKAQEQAEYWKGQTRRSKGIKTNPKAVVKLARRLIEGNGSTADINDVTRSLQTLYDFIANGGDEKNELAWSKVKEDASAIAYYILDNSEELVNSDELEVYKEIRNYIRTTKLNVSERDKQNIQDYNSWRKRNLPFAISKDGLPVDVAYMELQDLYGKAYFPDMYNTVDQLYQIVDVLQSMRPVYENPLGPYFNEAVEYMANEIIDEFFDLPQAAPTFADRQARMLLEEKLKSDKKLETLRAEKNERIAQIKADSQKRINEAIKKERSFRERKIAELKERYRSRDEITRERQTASELRGKIKRHFNKMSQRLLNPTERNHVPYTLSEPVAAFLSSVDFASDRMGEKTINKLRTLQEAYRKIAEGKSDVYIDLDPDLQDMLAELAETFESKSLNEMSVKELENLWKATKAIERTVYDANRALREGERRTISELGDAVIRENATAKGYTGRVFGQWIADTLNMDMLDSFSFFEELGSTMNHVFGSLREGLDAKIRHVKEAEDYMQKLLGDTKINEWTGKNAQKLTFETEGGDTITLTPAQVMALYNLNKQEDARNHIYIGGIKPADIVTRTGKLGAPKIERAFKPVEVTQQDVENIIKTLTPEQQRIADGITEFFTKVTSAWGNEVSRRLYGYDKFTVENYFPIVSDQNYLKVVYGETTDQTLKNMGFTKSRVKFANNPIILEDIFDVYTRQADQMGSYNAFVVPLSDIQKVWNYKTESGSVRQAVTKKFGNRAEAYFRKYIVDVNGGVRSEAGAAWINSLMGRYKAARIGLNLRVIVQQPTTYLRAAAILDPKYLAKGAVMKTNWERVLKYAPIAQWKDWGYFNFDTGKQMKDVFLGKENMSTISKIGDMAMAGAAWADRIAWARLWNACELEIADKNPGLVKGSEEFYKAVAERFNEVIDRTQVIDTVFHRSQIMRSADTGAKMMTAFMSEPIKSYNLLRTAAQQAIQKKTPEAKARLARAVIAFATTVTINNIITGLMDAWRDDDDEKEFTEKWMDDFAKNMMNELPSMIPGVKDVFSLLEGYSVDRMDMEAISDLIAAGSRALKESYTIGFKIADIGAKAADLLGVPASSFKREVAALAQNTFHISGSIELEYRATRLFYSINSSDNRGKYYDLLYAAKVKGDKYYSTMYNDMIEAGVDPDDIRAAMEKRMKKAEGVTKVEDLSSRYLSPEQQGVYDRYISSVSGNSLYRQKKDTVEDILYNYVIGSKSSHNEKIDAGKAAGVTPVYYALYQAALEIADEKNKDRKKRNDSYDQSEAKAAAQMLSGLSREAKAYLWSSVNSGWAKSSNPFK